MDAEEGSKGEEALLEGEEEGKDVYEAVIKLSPSDLELSDSGEEGNGEILGEEEVEVKNEVDSEDYEEEGDSEEEEEDNGSSWKGSSEEEEIDSKGKTESKRATGGKKNVVEKEKRSPAKRSKVRKRKDESEGEEEDFPKPKRKRGRPKQPRRLGVSDDYTSEEEEQGEGQVKPVLRPGSGYPVEFKLKVLKYADKHSNAATADKFGLQPKRVRDWKRQRHKIEQESEGSYKRRPRTDGYTVEEKLQAVVFASERSVDEARLLYNVDRRTIEKWKAKKEQFEERLLQGEGSYIRRTGSGRKPQYMQIEESLRDWIVTLRLKGITVNYKMILNKAKIFMEEDASLKDLPVPRTRTWVIGFLKRQNLHGLLGNTLGHEDPRELLNVELKTGESDIKSLADKLIEIPENPNKRNRRTISLEDKVNIIRRIEQGETQGTVAKSLRVATSTIQTIWSCRNDILHKFLNPKGKSKSDAIIWKTYSTIGTALQDWVEQQNSVKTVKVNGASLMEKAIQLSETYRLPQFTTEAKHWLKVFCKRNHLADVLAELKASPNTTASSSTVTPAQNTQINTTAPAPSNNSLLSGNATMNSSMDSSDHHHNTSQDDDFHSDLSDFLLTMHNDPTHQQNRHNPLQTHLPSISNSSSIVPSQLAAFHHHHLPSQQHHHQQNLSVSAEQIVNHQRFISSTSIIPAPTSTEAMKYITLLRSWIQSNSVSQEQDVLSNHLSVVENAVLKKRMSEI